MQAVGVKYPLDVKYGSLLFYDTIQVCLQINDK